MRKILQLKDSKKGFSLPVAIIVTSALIMLAASLIIIATNSLSTTSSDVNGRQAYLNVRSALEYAATYYNSVKNIDKMDTQCLIVQGDGDSPADGTATGTVKVVDISTAASPLSEDAKQAKISTEVAGKTTYVVATYNAATSTSPIPTLKLTAYSNYADSMGGRSKTARLSVTYNLGSSSGSQNRITVPTIDSGSNVYTYNTQNDTITLNMRQAPGQDWTLAYYIWTFKDRAGIYTDEATCYDLPTPSVSAANTNEDTDSGAVLLTPNGVWVGSGTPDKLGPPAVATSVGNDWYRNQFVPTSDQVNYFNIILARKGAVLSHGVEDTQTCEMFHLWYIDPSDKNVYFEFLKPHTTYVKGSSWNGSDKIEDTVLVYVNNPKTTIHFKMKDAEDDKSVVSKVASTPPVINSISVGGSPLSGSSYLNPSSTKAVSNLEMTYEGCGWWVANVETDDSFTMQITYRTKSSDASTERTKTINVTPNSSDEAWIVVDGDTIQARLSEDNANKAIGASSDDYVTIHVRPNDTSVNLQSQGSPTLNYKESAVKSSKGRVALLDKILEIQELEPSDYTNFDVIMNNSDPADDIEDQLLNNAITTYNDDDFISDQAGSTIADKIAAADEKYNDIISKLDSAMDKLISAICDSTTMTQLTKLVAEADKIDQAQSESNVYVGTYFDAFIADGGAYKKAKAIVSDFDADPSNVTLAVVKSSITALQTAINEINAHKLDKEALNTLIKQAERLTTTDRSLYTSDTMDELDAKLSAAKHTYQTSKSQDLIDNAKDNLQTAINGLALNATTDVSYLEALRAEVSTILSAEKENCTDESYAALESEYNSITASQIRAETSQTQINTWYSRLLIARDNFYIYKPENTDDKLNYENKIRVWLSGFDESIEGFESYSLIEYILGSENDDDCQTVAGTDSKIVKDVASGLSYIEIDKSAYDRISFKISANGKVYSSDKITVTGIASNNLVVKFNALAEDDSLTCSVTVGELTTVYIEKTTEIPQIKVGDTECTVASADENYYVVRFISAPSQTVAINTMHDGSGTAIPAFNITAGQWVVQYETETTVLSPVAVENIYKKYIVSTGSASRGYTISNASYISTDLVSPSILASVTGDYSIETTSTIVSKPVNITVSDDKIIIWIKYTAEDSAPRLYVWSGSGSSAYQYNGSWPGNQMIKYYESTDLYYTVVPNTAEHFLLVNHAGDNKLTPNDMTISKGSKNNTNNQYWEITSSYDIEPRGSLPTIEVEYEDVDVGDMTASGLRMALVGGNRVRITNKSYAVTYGSGNKKAEKGNLIYTSNPFGGDSSGSGRVGDAQLATMYDWYEFKIPVNALNLYTFDVKGLNLSQKSVLTKQLAGVYGDVWLELNSYDKDGDGDYSDIDIYTFNPDEVQMEDNTTIYFSLPENWSGLEVTASGVDSSVTKTLTSDTETGYHYATISKKTPFLTFTVKDEDDATRTYRTSLQGGDYILFNPEANAESGAWDTFVPIREQLKREILEAQGIYYGYVLIGKYDDNGYVLDNGADTYKYPEGIMTTKILGDKSVKDYIHNGSVITDDIDDSGTIKHGINSLSYDNAKTAYNNLHKLVTAYKSLYSAMSTAKSYIDTAPGGGKYPEYVNRGNKKTYSVESISNLKTKLASAETAYLSASPTVDSLDAATKALEAAASNVSVDSENTITVILYDAQGEAEKGSKFKIQYKRNESDTAYVVKDVTDLNPDGFPIIFIEEDNIYDVSFIVNGATRTISKAYMGEDEAWVYFDTAENPYWTENSTSDYKQINSDEMTQESSDSKYEYTMRTETDDSGATVYVPMTLYFQYDTVINRYNQTDGTLESYTIRAGAYYFDDANKKTGGVYPDTESPVRDGVINLYSEEAKAYFTNPANYGKYTEGNVKNSEELSKPWVTQSGTKLELTTGNRVTSYPVNFTANSGLIKSSRTYSTTKQMYFRWEGNKDLVVKNNVTLAASELTIASSGIIDASSVYGRHFYLSCTTAGADTMTVKFVSDVTIKYNDSTGKEHTFTIREGIYECSKASDSQTFIADLFDETYWTSKIHVRLIGRDGSEGSYNGGNTLLSNPTYSND